jgi:formylglycine-generating enzyme required for sulfatase activity
MSEMPLKYIRIPKYFPKYHPSANNNVSSETNGKNPIENIDYPKNEMIPIPKQNLTLGKSNSIKSFGWDNEYGTRTYDIPSFSASKFKITNGEFYEFVLDSGYHNQKLWSTTGWGWKTFRNIKYPSFWVNSGPQGLYQFELRNIFSKIPMQWDWPVCVNLHEAEAFINWKKLKTGKNLRILTELEHCAIRDDNQKQNNTSKDVQIIDPVLTSKEGRCFNDVRMI